MSDKVPWWQTHPREVGLDPSGCIPSVQAVAGSLVVLRDNFNGAVWLTAVDQTARHYMRNVVSRYLAEMAIPDVMGIECQLVLQRLVLEGLKVSPHV